MGKKYWVVGLTAVPLLVGSFPQTSFGQTSPAPSRNELELPDVVDPGDQNIDFQIDRNAEVRENCPFDNSSLTTNLTGVEFIDVHSGQLDANISAALGSISVPLGTQPLSVVCDIRDQANAELRKAGWIATVQIPQQELVNVLSLNVITSRISEVRIAGDTGPYREYLTEKIAVLTSFDPLNEKDVEGVLLGVNDVPGLSVKLGLAPSEGGAGNLVGNLSVTFDKFKGYTNVRNYNPSRIGRETGYSLAQFYGLTGLRDVSYLGFQATTDFQEQLIFQAGHEFALPNRKSRIGLDATYAISEPDIDGLGFETDAFIANLFINYPLARSLRFNADAELRFEYADQATKVDGFDLSEDALRSLVLKGRLRGQGLEIGGRSRLFYDTNLELRQGLDIFGATSSEDNGIARTGDVSASRPFGESDALVVRAGANLYMPFNEYIGVSANLEGQWTDNALLNYDEYSIGNLSIGRGYDPGANSGDRAIGSAFELIFTPYNANENKLELFGFYDVVSVENLDFGTPEPVSTLESIGGGIRYYLGNNIKAEVTYASPQDRALFTDETTPPDRVLLSLTTQFSNLLR